MSKSKYDGKLSFHCAKIINFTTLICETESDPNKNLLIQMAITLKICIFDPTLVVTKLMEVETFLKIVNKQLIWLYQHGVKNTFFSELYPFELANTHMGHTVETQFFSVFLTQFGSSQH